VHRPAVPVTCATASDIHARCVCFDIVSCVAVPFSNSASASRADDAAEAKPTVA
jgi:hypothetical protein